MASDGTDSLSEMTDKNKAAVLMIALDMEHHEKEDSTFNENVSSNNSLESDDIHAELQTTGNSKATNKVTDVSTQFKNGDAKDIETTQANYNDANRDNFAAIDAPGQIVNPVSLGEDSELPISEGKNGKEDVYLPRSALISTSKGLSARDYLDQAINTSSNDPEQYQTGFYNEPYATVETAVASTNAYGYQTDESYHNDATANQLYYDSSGLAYTYDGYQFYAAQNQPFYTEQHGRTPPQTCILTKHGETTYVSYIPADYMPQYCAPAQGFSQPVNEYGQIVQANNLPYSQCMPYIPPQSLQSNNAQTMEQTEFINGQPDDLNIQNWSTNDNADASDVDNKDDLAGVYESESGELLLVETTDVNDSGEAIHSCKTLNNFKSPNSIDSVPEIEGGLDNNQGKEKGDVIPQNCPFPSLFVSDNGLITIFMRSNVALEMTLDRDLRLVNHVKKLVVATNSRGSSSMLIHPAIKLSQSGTTTELELFLARKAKMTTDYIIFGNNFKSYKFDYKKIVEEKNPAFKVFSEDESVDFLSSGNCKGREELVSECLRKSSEAHYDYFSNGGYKVFVNGVRVVQNTKDDVYVTNGPKSLRMSSSSSRIGIQTHFIEAAVEPNWNIKIKRGTHTVNASHLGLVVSNGQIEAAFDDRNRLKAFRLPDRVPLRLGQSRQRRPGVHRRRYPYRGPESESEEDSENTSKSYS